MKQFFQGIQLNIIFLGAKFHQNVKKIKIKIKREIFHHNILFFNEMFFLQILRGKKKILKKFHHFWTLILIRLQFLN